MSNETRCEFPSVEILWCYWSVARFYCFDERDDGLIYGSGYRVLSPSLADISVEVIDLGQPAPLNRLEA